MKFSFNRKAEINQSLDIVVLSKEVEKLVADKLKIAQKEHFEPLLYCSKGGVKTLLKRSNTCSGQVLKCSNTSPPLF